MLPGGVSELDLHAGVGGEAAVHRHDSAGDEAGGLIAHQIQQSTDELVGRTEAPHGSGSQNLAGAGGVHPVYLDSVSGEFARRIEAIRSLIKGFVALGGHFMQLDIADTELLKRAQERPEEYQNLSVRVSGWNARFVTLNREWQDMIIAQTGSEL